MKRSKAMAIGGAALVIAVGFWIYSHSGDKTQYLALMPTLFAT